MTASIRASKFKYSKIHKFKLSSAENQRKRKRALIMHKRQRKKIEAQQTRTFDLLKEGSLQKEPKNDVGSVPAQ